MNRDIKRDLQSSRESPVCGKSVGEAMEIKKNKHFEHIRAFSVLAVITIHTMYSALLQFGEGALVTKRWANYIKYYASELSKELKKAE